MRVCPARGHMRLRRHGGDPSGSAITTQLTSVPWPTSTRRAPVIGMVLQTAAAQADLVPVTCGDSRGFDRRRRCIPHMSHAARIGPEAGLSAWDLYHRGCSPAAVPEPPDRPGLYSLPGCRGVKAEMIMATLRPARQPRCGRLSHRGRPAVPGRRPTRRNPARRRHLPPRRRLLFPLF